MKSIFGALNFAAAFLVCAATAQAVFNVRDYGAVGDGKQLETAAISQAVEACTKAGGGTVYLPAGRYLTGTIELKSNTILELDAGATLLNSENPDDYPLRENPWIADGKMIASLIYAQDAENVTVTGRGTINGQGRSWWERMWSVRRRPGMPPANTPAERANTPAARPTESERPAEARTAVFRRPELIRFLRCKEVLIEKIHLINSPTWNIHPLLCESVRVDGVTIENPVPSPNTDGINPDGCRNVQIANCRIDTGDDCVTLKSGTNELGRRMGRLDENITITNCVMLKGHGGVTIGSEMSGGVRNVTVTNCVFQGTDVGIRIKSQRGRGGLVEGLVVSNVVMHDVAHPFVITTFYMGADKPDDVFPVNDGTPRYRGFQFNNITARGAKDAGSITGLREMPIENIVFDNIRLQGAKGFTCTSARGVSFHDVVIDSDQGPALILHNAEEIDTSRLRTETPHAGTQLVDSDALKNR